MARSAIRGIPNPMKRKVVHLSVWHGPGSLEHFYHFLLGCFVPLAYHLTVKWARADFDRLILRSCGPLDRIVREFGDRRVRPMGKRHYRGIAERCGAGANGSPAFIDLEFAAIRGGDYPADFSYRIFSKVREHFLSRPDVRSERSELEKIWPGGQGRILLIERAASPAFYHSEKSENKGSGAERRSIANHDELYQMLQHRFGGCLNVRTEAMTLARQVALFSLADIIVAQHGAALANIVWSKPTVSVIEIFPITQRIEVKDMDPFRHLSRCMGVRFYRAPQENDHAAIDIGQIVDLVDASSRSGGSHSIEAFFRRMSFEVFRTSKRIRRALRKRLGMRGFYDLRPN